MDSHANRRRFVSDFLSYFNKMYQNVFMPTFKEKNLDSYLGCGSDTINLGKNV